MKSLVCVLLLLVFVLLEVIIYCEGCWKQEREALVTLNSHLGNVMSWSANNSTDCCEWEGLECNTAGRVTKLNLQFPTESLNYSDFAIFKDLKTLDLSYTGISNCTTTLQGYFSYKLYSLIINHLNY